ncbi:unnamed protein product [Protopolystoma xenopodis]|uniref:Uncharacterized protein n=1 Tax=Protopolystoma xenopodis TaxID=117903 RepID=A0A448XF10_9PLAT|nr:unnamed protein product [Protopolystoma xenopodis]
MVLRMARLTDDADYDAGETCGNATRPRFASKSQAGLVLVTPAHGMFALIGNPWPLSLSSLSMRHSVIAIFKASQNSPISDI